MDERASQLCFLQAELDAANAQNERLIGENAQLRQKLERLIGDERSKSTLNVEARLKAFQFEDERDRMYENLEKLKRKYNQLHEAFLQKVKRCKALEEVFHRQKTLNGLVMKSAIAQKEKEQKILLENRQSALLEQSAVETLQNQVTSLRKELDEAYDIIDELEFELESIDFLEMENQRLQDELRAIKKQKFQLRTELNPIPFEGADPDHDDAPPRYSELEGATRDSNASSLADSFAGDMDPETIERAALTESLIKTAEAESNCLRRELLRSRLRRTIRDVRPTSSSKA